MSGLLVVLCCFVLCRVHLTLKDVGSYGGEASPGIFYYMEYVYTLCVVTGLRFLTRTIPLRNMNSMGIFLLNVYTSCVVMRIGRVYSYAEYKQRV